MRESLSRSKPATTRSPRVETVQPGCTRSEVRRRLRPVSRSPSKGSGACNFRPAARGRWPFSFDESVAQVMHVDSGTVIAGTPPEVVSSPRSG